MKIATIPAVRVEPAVRAEIESLLLKGETLSQFVETSVRASLKHRRGQAEFVARGLQSLQQTQTSGAWVPADVVLAKLEGRLDAARSTKVAVATRQVAVKANPEKAG